MAISNGKYRSQIYENKYKVDAYIKKVGLPAVFFYTGNFFENTIFRSHVKLCENGELEFHQPVILPDTKCILHCSIAYQSGIVVC